MRTRNSSLFDYDAVFIGGGGAGRAGALYLRKQGKKVLLIDRDDHFGGKCPKNACYAHHLFYDCAVEIDFFRQFAGKLWWPEFSKKVPIMPVIELFKTKREKTYQGILQHVENSEMDYILDQEAKILEPHVVEAGRKKITAEAIVVATGARAHLPPIPGVGLRGVFNYETLIEQLDYEPEKVVVIGASKVGTPYASFFNASGCETTLVDKAPFLAFLDDEVRDYVLRGMAGRGMSILQETRVLEIIGDERVRSVRLLKGGQEYVLDADTVFISAGMIPDSELVQHLGVARGSNCEIEVNNRMETNIPGIYAAGDVIGPPMEQWKARKSGIIAARSILGQKAELRFDLYPEQLHSTYEISWVGLTEKQAHEKSEDVRVLRMGIKDANKPGITPMAERMMLMGHIYPEKTGFQKMLYDGSSGKVLGLHHVGYGAKDSFSYLAYLMEKGLTIEQLAEMTELFMNSSRFIQMARQAAAASAHQENAIGELSNEEKAGNAS